MPRPVKVSVPARAVPVMKWLASLSDQEFQSLLDRVSNGDDHMLSRTELGNRIQDAFPDAPSTRGAELVTELYSLINLNSTHGWLIDDIVAVASSASLLHWITSSRNSTPSPYRNCI